LPWYVFIRARTLEYWRGVSEAGGIPSRRRVHLRVLAYHAISDLRGRGVLEPYGVPLDQLRRQVTALRAHGFHPITIDEFVAFTEGRGGLPRRPVLFTFDDGYDDLPAAFTALQAEGVEAVVFAVSGLLGRENEWDRMHGGPPLRLLDADGLRQLRDGGIEIGGHSRTHPVLPALAPADIEAEVRGCVEDLEALSLGPVRFYAYPYGETDGRVARAVQAAGLVAFGVQPGVMTAETDLRHVPRLEIVRADDGVRFLAKVIFARELGWAVPFYRRVKLLVRRVTGGGRRRLGQVLRQGPNSVTRRRSPTPDRR
jgi:peptidoglycan/xylan/chitin deacetylase (PgdA/CDA1 family)